MFGSSKNYKQFPGSHPSIYNNSSMLGKGLTPSAFERTNNQPPDYEIASENLGLLLPAFVGTAAFGLLTQLFGYEGPREEEKDPLVGKIGSIVFTGITIAGISWYIYYVLIEAGGRPLNAFLPVSSGIGVMILYFAAVYNWLYRIDPKSFSGEIDGNALNEIVAFIYFSITTFSTAGMGDMAPITKTAKILVSIQVLFFVFIFTMGLVFFVDP